VELVTTRLDFGLIRLGSQKTRMLRLKNASATCGATWVLEEMVTKEGSVPRQMVSRGGLQPSEEELAMMLNSSDSKQRDRGI